jgi:hypothetical protein
MILMTRAAWMIAACTLSLAPLAQAQQFPVPANVIEGPLRYAQAPVTPLPPAQRQLRAPQPQEPPEPAPVVAGSMSEVTPTPEMWFYERAREEYQDPRNAVRANAEYRSEERRKRLAASQWFGYSNARPSHTVTPTTQAASPQWGSNTRDPYIWSGSGSSTIVHLPASPFWR